MTENQSQLDAALQQEATAITNLQQQEQTNNSALTTALGKLAADLQAYFAANPPAPDFTSEVNSITAQLSNLSAIASAEQSAITGATTQVQSDDASIPASTTTTTGTTTDGTNPAPAT